MAAAEDTTNDQRGLYGPLDGNKLEIRLLDLEGSSEYDSEIQCRLRTISLTDFMSRGQDPHIGGPRDSFETLSYTWGGGAASKTILVDGQAVSITANLESFLRRRREEEAETEAIEHAGGEKVESKGRTVALWVDALCINQDNAAEKNGQIPLMGWIYAFSSRLNVWLGPASDDSSLAMRWLSELGRASPYHKLPGFGREVTLAMRNLLSRPWWARVWVVQELAFGGMGPRKFRCLTVRCGKDSLPWAELVVAAARMHAHRDDQRQPFPNVDEILQLDSLREATNELFASWGAAPSPVPMLDLVTRYRGRLATDPRDKIYAVGNMLTLRPSQRMPTRYDAAIESVYVMFAQGMLIMSKQEQISALEILRHCGCGPSALPKPYGGERQGLQLPSWVPDWSVPLGCQPLPLRRDRRYLDVPWWAEPIDLTGKKSQFRNNENGETGDPEPAGEEGGVGYEIRQPFPVDSPEATRQRTLRLRRLEMGANGFGIVREDLNEVPPNFTFHTLGEEIKQMYRELLKLPNFILQVQDERYPTKGSLSSDTGGLDAVAQGQIITERRMKRWLLQELRGDDPDAAAIGGGSGSSRAAPYRAAAATEAEFEFVENGPALRVKGILWDKVEECHAESFVEDVEAEWQAATRFTVAVGSCKATALTHKSANTRYPAEEQRLEAFWQTLFAGQFVGPDRFQDDEATGLQRLSGREPELLDRLCYADWLPEVPTGWTAAEHPTAAATTSGLVEFDERAEAFERALAAARAKDPEKWSGFRVMATARANYSAEECGPAVNGDGEEAERRQHHDQRQAELAALAAAWRSQPYDLYHRPFRFLHVVPDPYWNDRRRDDERALRQTRRWRTPMISSWGAPPGSDYGQAATAADHAFGFHMPSSVIEAVAEGEGKGKQQREPPLRPETHGQLPTDEREELLHDTHELSAAAERELLSQPSRIPQATLEPGVEKYALGRRFFITKEGHFGLGPRDTRPGDRIAVLFGSGVPFVLREREAGSQQQEWQLVGESYVHDIMKGEVMRHWEAGKVQEETILLT